MDATEERLLKVPGASLPGRQRAEPGVGRGRRRPSLPKLSSGQEKWSWQRGVGARMLQVLRGAAWRGHRLHIQGDGHECSFSWWGQGWQALHLGPAHVRVTSHTRDLGASTVITGPGCRWGQARRLSVHVAHPGGRGQAAWGCGEMVLEATLSRQNLPGIATASMGRATKSRVSLVKR